MKISTQIATQEPTTISAELVAMVDGVYGRIHLSRIRISPDNRKRFNAQKLQELADSIQAVGVAQTILIRPVTPTALEPQEYEIVAGERRYRASTLAGLADIPAMVRVLSDVHAAKLRILENLQREDPHPMEEAEGYQQLMLKHGYSADQLADEINKSRSYVFGRLKLCALTLEVREQFLDDKISASIALLIARIPLPALQVKAFGEIARPACGDPMSYRSAAMFVQQRYMLDLVTAIFDRADTRLLASAGACGKCPKRTGNQPDIFAGIGADVCTDPDCFGEKKAAHHAITLVQANKKGIPVLEGDAAASARRAQWGSDSTYASAVTYIHNFARNAPATQNAGNVGSHLKADQLPPVAAYIKNDDGSMVALFSRTAMQAALEAADVCETFDVHAARMQAASAGNKLDPNKVNAAQAAKDAAEAALTAETESHEAFRVALYKQLRARGATNGFGLQSLREFAKLTLGAYSLPAELADLYPFGYRDHKAAATHIDQAGLPEIQLLLVDCVVAELLTISRYCVKNGDYLDDDFSSVVAMARAEGIDPHQVKLSMKMAALAVADVDADTLLDFLKFNPDRVGEMTAFIMADRPHLVGALEIYAKDLGYVYSGGTFAKPAVVVAAAVQEVVAEAADGAAVAVAPTTGDDVEAAIAAPAKKVPKAKPAAVKAVLAPAAAWPFPKTSSTVRALQVKEASAAPAAAPSN